MTRDTYEMFTQAERGRARFGDNEQRPRANAEYRSDLIDLTLLFRMDKGGGLAVADPFGKDDAPWIWLPKSEIEFERQPGGTVKVTLPQSLAQKKGLV